VDDEGIPYGEERRPRKAAGPSALLGGLAALIALGIVIAGGYMIYTTAGAPPPARPSAKPQPPPPPTEDETPQVDEEVKAYIAQVDAIMHAREIALQALSDVVTLGGPREMAVDEAMAITVRRREVTKDALDEFLQLETPGQAARIHELYVKFLNDDITLTDQTVAALRAGDAGKAADLARTRDSRAQETLNLIRETAKVLGIGNSTLSGSDGLDPER
jgi:hypothetical protein